MEFQYDKSWNTLESTLSQNIPTNDAWYKFIKAHEELISKPYYKELIELDIAAEQEPIINWLNLNISNEPLPSNIVAIWIGITKFTNENDEEIPTIYFCGADNYSKDDIDWACNATYLPQKRYAQPQTLRLIDHIVKADKLNYQFLDWILPVAYCAFTFDEIIRTKLDKTAFLSNRSKLFVSVGHDDGDYIDISPIQ